MYQTGIRAFAKGFLSYVTIAAFALGLFSFASVASAQTACTAALSSVPAGSGACCQMLWRTDTKKLDNDPLRCSFVEDSSQVAKCFGKTGSIDFGLGGEGFDCAAKNTDPSSQGACETVGGILYKGAIPNANDGSNCGCPTGQKLNADFTECIGDPAPLAGGTAPSVDGTPVSVTFKPQVSIPFSTEFIRGQDVKVDGALIARYVKAVYSFFLAITGFIAVVMFMVAGVQYMVSRDTKGAQAKETMKNAALGLLAMFVTYQVLNTISNALVEFKSLDVVPVRGENVQAKNGSCYQFQEMFDRNGKALVGGTAIAPEDNILNYAFTAQKLSWVDSENVQTLTCHASKKSIPVWYKDQKTGEFVQSGTCSGHICKNPGDVCFGYTCQNVSDGIMGGRLVHGSEELRGSLSSKIFTDYVYVKKIEQTSSNQALTDFWACANGGNQVKLGNIGDTPAIHCFDGKKKTYLMNGTDSYLPEDVSSDDVSDTDAGWQVLSLSDARDLTQNDLLAVIAKLRTTEYETTHCEVADGAPEGSLNYDTRYAFVGKNGTLTDVIPSGGVSDYFYSQSDLFDNCTAQSCPKRAIDVRPAITQVPIDVSSYRYASFCALNHP